MCSITLSPWYFSEPLCHIHRKGGLNQKLPKIPYPPGRIPSACGHGPGSNVSGVIPFPTPVSLTNTLTPCSVASVSLSRPSHLAGKNQTGKWFFSLLVMTSAEQALGLVVFIPTSLETEEALRHQYASLSVEMCLFPWEHRGASTSERSVCQRVGSVNPRMRFKLKTLWTQV